MVDHAALLLRDTLALTDEERLASGERDTLELGLSCETLGSGDAV